MFAGVVISSCVCVCVTGGMEVVDALLQDAGLEVLSLLPVCV